MWKTIKEEYIQTIKSSQTFLALLPATVNHFAEEDAIEVQLKTFFAEHRKSLGSNIKWDEKLSGMLVPALGNYEMERVAGLTYCQEEFQSAIKNYIPEGHTFKAFPIQFNHRRAKDIFNVLKNAPVSSFITIE